jgi:hypothetical protein
VKVIVVHDLTSLRTSSGPVRAYAWTVLKAHALCRELDRTLLEVEHWANVLDSAPEAPHLVAEAQTLLVKLESEVDQDDDQRRS